MAEQYQNQKLVNKQYNSPINLYSDRNVRDILERESQVLSNGAIGIDFNNPTTNKPTNLQNSAVLRMLEEEENRKSGRQPGSLKRIAWPPPNDTELEQFIEQQPVHAQGGPLLPSKSAPVGSQNNQVQSETIYQRQSQTISNQVQVQSQSPQVQVPWRQQPQTPSTPSNTVQNAPSFATSQQFQQPPAVNNFQPVFSPSATTPSSSLSPGIDSRSPGLAQDQVSQPQRYQVPSKPVEPPPSTITLRSQAPVSQAPPPLVTSQPATATLRGGKNLRGDLKWPPEDVRERMAAEEQHLVEISKGPAVKPRKNCKDYSGFFAKHALTHVYPGYKIPPGTQFYDHNPVM